MDGGLRSGRPSRVRVNDRRPTMTRADLSRLRHWSPVPLRLILGYGFMAHGYAKVINGPDHFAATLNALGVPQPNLMAWATIAFELAGGLAVLVGAWIPIVSVPLAAILTVAAVTVHLPYGFTAIKLRAVTAAGPQFGPPGYETNLLYLAGLVTLVLGGAGPFAVSSENASDSDAHPHLSAVETSNTLHAEGSDERTGGREVGQS
jgi:putative oxidoreductase